MEKILEKSRTRKITWLFDIAGNIGKSLFTDMLEENLQYGCLALILDLYRSFKYTSVKLISDYIDQKVNPLMH